MGEILVRGFSKHPPILPFIPRGIFDNHINFIVSFSMVACMFVGWRLVSSVSCYSSCDKDRYRHSLHISRTPPPSTSRSLGERFA